ncbi:MAG: GNAT family N-acetyltransferase [Acidimicrobiia bacterium]
MADIQIRDLTTIDEFRQVVQLEKEIWGYTDASDMVGIPVFIFTVHRGAILVGAFEPGGRMVGFAYAVVGRKDGRPMMWSHMAGVLPDYRGGLGYGLKLAQRDRALAQGYDLIEWTFDPMQAMNAHFNLAKLGGVVSEYAVNFYGESTSALHRGTPTDRIVLSWNLTSPHVVRRLETPAALRARAQEAHDAPIVNTTTLEGEWRKTTAIDWTRTERRIWIEIPTGFTQMQHQAPDRALAWRMDVRQMFQACLAQGYKAVDFVLQREEGFGRYLLARDE